MALLESLDNVNITDSEELITPNQIKKECPQSLTSYETVRAGRQILRDILDGKDKRFLVIVGPCSIHDPKAAMDYAEKLADLSKTIRDKVFVVMRVYFEKPRTTVGWKGLINDPYLDDSFCIGEGLKIARRLLNDITSLGVPAATETLDPISPQYISEFISWAAIGARTTESQTHREIASGMSMPVGIKNGTDGSLQVAMDALTAVKNPHHFLGINKSGKTAKFGTRGNSYAHIVLRGGGGKPNYDRLSIAECERLLEKNQLRKKIMVDCSHANSNKNHENQPLVLQDCLAQIADGNKSICGFMIESNLFAGSQPITDDLKNLAYGISITDKCVDWETTVRMLTQVAK